VVPAGAEAGEKLIFMPALARILGAAATLVETIATSPQTTASSTPNDLRPRGMHPASAGRVAGGSLRAHFWTGGRSLV